MSSRYYDRSGQPYADSIAWANDFTEEKQRVAQDQIGEAWISTAFV